jgi:hypothetical protein
MSRLATRLTNLEKRHKPPKEMLGAYEVHCVGGLGRIEGERCQEHEDCVFTATPLPGRLRRVIVGEWHEGMTDLLG